ncbi:fungal specific transcription factor domain-containing protein [Aspergillus ibericus CBS 121593]|uniref:Fungal-specific transcription factor domain protein n=1 Tax=Aspergillus ibericus CBS 121593 TaxID=1448316 RepID=A0A395GP49_9EURO|nr:fungal-specific transcription factor domain protein [Aspergillus ibericus CBS 121593]RAK97281.1 fungal-specific transcription factor domain protein [Aspergillus ibericus CBS 121593]
MVSTPTISRQRPGSACEECRRRKVRCDRRRPQCQVCFETGIECKINTTRLPRGPRKGQLRTLRTRIAALERCLADQHPEINHQMASLFDGSVLDCDSEEDPLRDLPPLPDPLPVMPDAASDDQRSSKSPRSPGSPSRPPGLVSDLMRADLDQLYFDRVHPFAPILQRWRYHVWAKQPKKTEAQTCLQYAMWTVAASLSAQFQSLRDRLYTETRRMLDAMDLQGLKTEAPSIEQAQAWILVCIYEYMQVSALQAWMSTGRCCRLVLGMRLYELDDPNSPVTMAREQEAVLVDWIGLEEQRRTFWMAYSLDRFISFHNGLPFTLNEQMITTRLPCPEEDFQAGQPTLTSYLSELMTPSPFPRQHGPPHSHPHSLLPHSNPLNDPLSSFTELILLATIVGRALSHRQTLAVEQLHPLHNHQSLDSFWARHTYLHDLLTHRIQILSTYPQVDPMLMFARIIAQSMVLFLHSVLETITWKTGDHLLGIIEFERVCVLAAHEVVGLVKVQSSLGYFKVHPLTPTPLIMCTEFFSAHGYLDTSFEFMLQELLESLQEIERVKNPVHSPTLSGQ